MTVYICRHDGPCGSSITGVYATLAQAESAKRRWDKAHKDRWDHLSITEHKVTQPKPSK